MCVCVCVYAIACAINTTQLYDTNRVHQHKHKQMVRVNPGQTSIIDWQFVITKLTAKSGIAPLTTKHGHLATSDHEKAEILNQYFASAFTYDDGLAPTFHNYVPIRKVYMILK